MKYRSEEIDGIGCYYRGCELCVEIEQERPNVFFVFCFPFLTL